MKEIIVLSGKGGTGKTSITASLAALGSGSSRVVLADCDVDAADLHLILDPRIQERHEFVSGHLALIHQDRCARCGLCASLCRFDGVDRGPDGSYHIGACEGCGVCVDSCPNKAISFPERHSGEWYVSQTRFGPLVHAELKPGAENSGKLVTIVRKAAREAATRYEADYLLVDGSPGIGCPVIASITGANLILVVSEPSLSGIHDLRRVMELATHFKVPLMVVINKEDINLDVSERIRKTCQDHEIPLAGSVSYDTTVTAAQMRGLSVVEYATGSLAATQMAAIWKNILEEPWKH